MWQDLLLKILKTVTEKATPQIREKLKELLDNWEDQAKATPNYFDDLLVFVVRGLIGI